MQDEPQHKKKRNITHNIKKTKVLDLPEAIGMYITSKKKSRRVMMNGQILKVR